MEHESLRTREQRLVDLAKTIERNTGCDLRRGACRRFGWQGWNVRLVGLQGRVSRFKFLEMIPDERIRQLRRDSARLDERARPALANGRMRRDGLVHHRLRERWLVTLVVAVPPVADEIDQEIEAEAHAIFPGEARRLEARNRIV